MKIPNFFFHWFWKDLYYSQISTRIWPRNKWAIKVIPRQWNDLDTIFVNVLYAGIINYVDGEKCFEVIDWSDTKDRKDAKQIKEIYQWAKIGRNKKLEELENAYPEISKNLDLLQDWINSDKCGTYKQKYGKVIKIEKFIKDRDDKYLSWIILNREILWT